MAYMLRQGGKTDYNYKEYYFDTEAEFTEFKNTDFVELKKKKLVCPGSVAYIISGGTVYILNSQFEWIAQ